MDEVRPLLICVVLVTGCGRLDFDLRGDGGGAATGDASPDVFVGPSCAGVPAGSTDFHVAGAGTVDNPWLVCTEAQLYGVFTTLAAWSDSFALGADLDMAAYTSGTGMPLGGIGTPTTPFTGTFDGNGHVVAHVIIEVPGQDGVGFFGVVKGSTALIRRLHLTAVGASGRDSVGCLAGTVLAADIMDCSTTGSASGRNFVGGLVGSIDEGARVSASSSAANATSSMQAAGGLVGEADNGGEILNSFASGLAFAGTSEAGGLVGSLSFFGEIWDSYATGGAQSQTGFTGGLVGFGKQSLVYGSFSLGNVSSMTTASGPTSVFSSADANTVVSSYALSTATCLIDGAPCAADVDPVSLQPLDYFQTSTNQPMVFWDHTHVWSLVDGSLPTVAPMFFDYAAWGDCTTQQAGSPFAGGWGVPEAPFLICTANQLSSLHAPEFRQGGAVRLMDDLALTGTWFPIGSQGMPTWLVLDGNGKTISGFIETDSSAGADYGLFGVLDGGIRRLAMTAVNVTSSSTNVGAFGGEVQGSIVDSYVSGSVTGKTYVGGLTATHGGFVGNCYSRASVTATAGAAAGLVYAADTVLESFDDGAVSGVSNSGQLAGYDTYSGTACAADAGVYAGFEDYFDSMTTCVSCCSPTAGNAVPSSWFLDASNPPMSTWDFTHIWVTGSDGYPSLR